MALLNSGRHRELEAALAPLLETEANSAFLWGLLGACWQLQGRDGLFAFEKAVAFAPDDAEAQVNLATVLAERGATAAAIDRLRQALARHPNHLRGRLQLAHTLARAGDNKAAAKAYRELLTTAPSCLEALLGLSTASLHLGDLATAEDCCRQALALAPQSADAHFCLGELRRRQGRLVEARDAYADAVRRAPAHVLARNNWGSALIELGQPREAETVLREALRQAPDHCDVLANLARLFADQHRFAEACALLEKLVRWRRTDPDPLARLGWLRHELGQPLAAEEALQQAIELAPERNDLRWLRALSLLPIMTHRADESLTASERFASALDDLGRRTKNQTVVFPGHLVPQLPFLLAYRPGNPCPTLSAFGELLVRPQLPASPPPKRTRLRLLIVSQHLRRHSVWDILLHGLLREIDRRQFEVIVYHLGFLEDEQTARARSLAECWRDRASVTDAAAWRQRVIDDAPDAIYYPEVGMDPVTCSLAAQRLAPLQLAGWGHPVTSGLPTIDYYVSGELIEAPNAEAHYSERLVRLPGTGCYTVPWSWPERNSASPVTTLPNAVGVRFVLAQRAFKFEPADDFLYAEIAAGVGEATFLLFSDPVYPWASEQLRQRLQKRCDDRLGNALAARFVVLPWLPAPDFLALLDACDVFLDCPAFSGYTTAWQALHCGLPIVTREGPFLRQRLAAGLLRKAGLTATIAHSNDEYIRLATTLAAESGERVLCQERRERQRRAAKQVDGDLDVVRAFEQLVLNACREDDEPPSPATTS